MKFAYLTAIVLQLTLGTVAYAQSDRLDYTLQVNGMTCPFCAYGVEQKLQALPGVVPGSVHAHLDQGLVTLETQAGTPLSTDKLRQLLLASGFTLENVTSTPARAESTKTPHG